MNVQWFIYKAAGEPREHTPEPHEGRCALCGVEIKEGVPVKKILSDSFTNHDVIKGSHLCLACAHLLKGELATKLRRSSFVATEKGIELFKNERLAEILFNPPEPPFVICFTTSFKKHNAFRAHLNYSKDLFYVRWEDRLVEFNRKEAAEIFRLMIRLYYAEVSRDELRMLQIAPSKISKIGLWIIEALKELQKHKGTLLYELLLEALPAKKREIYKKALKKRERRRKDAGGKADGSRGKGGKSRLSDVEELRLF